MSGGEAEIIEAIWARLDALVIALDEDEASLGTPPATVEALRNLSIPRRVASRALLKTVEQLEDQLARLFRVLPASKLIDTNGWFAQDYANFAEKLGLIPDAFAWTAIVRLRNRLVHDYPLDEAAQLAKLQEASAAAATLRAAAIAARRFTGREEER